PTDAGAGPGRCANDERALAPRSTWTLGAILCRAVRRAAAVHVSRLRDDLRRDRLDGASLTALAVSFRPAAARAQASRGRRINGTCVTAVGHRMIINGVAT